MTTLALNDLVQTQDLDKQAMAKVLGSGQGFGNYSHTHFGAWVTTNLHRHFRGFKLNWRTGRFSRVYQYHKTRKQVNVRHQGWIA